jgi:PAS domain S-box-containing protein
MQTQTEPTDVSVSSYQADPRQVLVQMAALIASLEGQDAQALDRMLAFTLEALHGRFAVYQRFDMALGRITIQHGCRLPEDFRPSGALVGRICYEELAAAGKPQVFFPDLRATIYPATDPDVGRYGLRAYAGAAVRQHGRVIGALAVFDDRPRDFDAVGRMVLPIMAHWIAGIGDRLAMERQLAQKGVSEQMLSAISAKAISTQGVPFLEFCIGIIGQTLKLDLACLQWYDPDLGCFDSNYFHWTPQGVFQRVDTDAARPLGLQPIRDVLERRRPLYCPDSSVINDGPTQSYIRRKNVSAFVLMPICNPDKVYGLFTMAMQSATRDWAQEESDTLMTIMGIIAQWKEARAISQQLDESRALNEQLYQLSPAAIYRIDLRNLRLIKVNAEACRYTGYSEEELMAMPPDELLTPPSREAFYRQMSEIEAGLPAPEDLEFEFTTKHGAREWGHLHIRHLYDQEGQIWGANVVAHLITEKKKAREELDGYRRRLEALVEERTRELSLANQQLREEIVRRSEMTRELHMKSERLEELNTAMRVLLDKRNEDRLRSEENIRVNLVQLIEPYLDRMVHSGLNEAQHQLLNVIRMNLNEVVGSPMPELSAKYYIFSPGELQVANLIRKGRTTKDMARLLNISPRTVESYRNNIRKKLGLKSKKVNLKTYLSSKE